jgi:putative redox protein
MSDATRRAHLRLVGEGLRFEGTTPKAETPVILDGDASAGPSPMEALLLALAGCMAVDVRMILERSRVPVTALDFAIEGDRRGEAPRYFESIRMHLTLVGPSDADAARIERAVRLSEEKYCSVHHSLRPDLQIQTTWEIASPGVS